jgi:hypothetical protein
MTLYVIHLKCSHCDFVDICAKEEAKNWKCPNCLHVRGMFLDFFKDSSEKFQGRMDEGKITIQEIFRFY